MEGAILHAPAFRHAKWSSPSERHLIGRARRGDLAERLAHMTQNELIMVLCKIPGSDLSITGFRAEASWLAPVRWRLARDPRFVVGEDIEFLPTGYRLMTYRSGVATAEGGGGAETG